jgi:prophage regulatory protein
MKEFSLEDIPGPRLLRLQEVADRLGVGTNAVYNYIKTSGFPQPVRVGPRVSRWPEDEVEKWLARRPRGLKAPSEDARQGSKAYHAQASA